MSEVPRHLSITQAAEVAGTSRRAIEARVERGTLRSERQGRHVVIPLAAMYEAGLLQAPEGAVTVDGLLDRLERQAETIGELRNELRRAGVNPP